MRLEITWNNFAHRNSRGIYIDGNNKNTGKTWCNGVERYCRLVVAKMTVTSLCNATDNVFSVRFDMYADAR